MMKPFIMEGIKKLAGVKYKLTISGKESEDPYILLDLLWSNTPLWSGSIKSVLSHKRFFSLIIYVPPTESRYVYSSLKYIEQLALKSNKVPVCIFDQALW